jgi:hypothetical protein
MVMEVMAMEDMEDMDMDMDMEDMDMDMEDMDMAMEDMDMDPVMDMDTAMATLIGTMVTGTTGTVMADGGAATGMATVSVHAGAGHPAVTSGFATSRDLLISGNSGRRLRTVALLFQGGSGVA